MDLDKMKSSWRQAGTNIKSQDELLTLTKFGGQPGIRNIRIKFLTEFILLLIFMLIYYNAFDGDLKPLWVNIILIGLIIFYRM